VLDGFGVWCAARRLNAGGFVWPREAHAAPLSLTQAQFDALVLGLPCHGWSRQSFHAVAAEMANQVRQRAQAMLLQLAQEKGLLYQKLGSLRAVASHLEQLERQLRSTMPQHVMDMLGQQAAFMAR
jgi:hypothetical protein